MVAVMDINSIANAMYEHNFGIKPQATNIEHRPVEYYERLGADLWLMSPPCQPFTQGGSRLDDEDLRSAGLLYLTKVLQEMRNPPPYIFLENVPNFEVSRCHQRLIAALQIRGYGFDEYMISPLDPFVAIPNNRKRYYLAGRLGTPTAQHVQRLITGFSEQFPGIQPAVQSPQPLSAYLDPLVDASFAFPERHLDEYKKYRHGIQQSSY